VDDAVKKQVESVLFSASTPVSVKEINEITGISSSTISSALRSLRKDYNNRDTAMEIVRIGKKYIMQISEIFSDQSMMIAPPAIDNDTLKTLTLIAFHQPIKQSNLRRLVGEKIYNHVDFLSDLGLIYAKKYKSTEILRLSPRFFEYFGIEKRKPEDIRSFLMEKVAKQSIKKEGKEK
jgi:segregation and condensation protein B